MKYAFFVAEDINLGVGYIASYLKKQGHEVKLFFDPRQFARGYARQPILAKLFSVEGYNLRAVKKYNPDVVCFSCVTATYKWALSMARKVKRTLPSCRVVFGGVHPTLVPEEVKKHDFVDEVITGDGVEHFGGEFDPDHLWPDREMFFNELPSEHRHTQLFMTSFGCPYNCSFCGNEQLRKVKKHKFFRRNAEHCISELLYLKEEWGLKYVLFVDDIFTSDRTWLEDFLHLYKRDISLPFCCFVHPSALTEQTVKLLKDAGCHTAWLGIQTGSEQLRKEILNRQESTKAIVDCCKWIKDAGIKLMVDHIFGIPFESNTTQEQSYGLYTTIEPDVVNCYELLYFPKAKIIEHAIRCGYLATSDVPKIEAGEGIVYQVGNKGQKYYDTYAKGFVTIPLGGIVWELLPMMLIKLIVHLKAGRWFMPIVMIQNEVFFTWRALLKKARFFRGMV